MRKSKRGTPFLGCRCVFINDEQDGYNACDEFISTDATFYVYERKRDGERYYRLIIHYPHPSNKVI